MLPRGRIPSCKTCPHQQIVWVEHHGPEQLFVLLFVALAFLLLWALYTKEKDD